MSKVRFELDRAGVRALMRSPEMQAVLKARADTVKDRCRRRVRGLCGPDPRRGRGGDRHPAGR